MMRVRLLGTGDAFGSGGRFQSCILVEAEGELLLLDCGATSPTALTRAGVRHGEIDVIVTTHFHGDHFGGIPFVILDEHFSGRDRPLTIAGPAGVEERVLALTEALYPGLLAEIRLGYPLEFVSLLPGRSVRAGTFTVEPVAVNHSEASRPLGLRVAAGGKTLAYSGDSAWTPALGALAHGADAFVCESFSFSRPIPNHLAFQTLAAHRAELGCRRLILTHLGPDMLENGSEAAVTAAGAELAHDGMSFDL